MPDKRTPVSCEIAASFAMMGSRFQGAPLQLFLINFAAFPQPRPQALCDAFHLGRLLAGRKHRFCRRFVAAKKYRNCFLKKCCLTEELRFLAELSALSHWRCRFRGVCLYNCFLINFATFPLERLLTGRKHRFCRRFVAQTTSAFPYPENRWRPLAGSHPWRCSHRRLISTSSIPSRSCRAWFCFRGTGA